MPAYANNPFQKTQLLQKGVAAYLLGSFSHQDGNGNFAITNLALTSNVGVVTVQLITGPLPIVGNYISLLNNATIGTVSQRSHHGNHRLSLDGCGDHYLCLYPCRHSHGSSDRASSG